MQMTDVRDKLQLLQDVLSEKYAIEKTVMDAPKQLSVQEALLVRQRKEYIEKHEVYEECKNKVMFLEADLITAVKSREDGEKGMDNISTHREYEALDKQITEATAKEAEIRKELDKEKKVLNEINEDLKFIEAGIKATDSSLQEAKASINKEMASLESKLNKLEKKEAEITEGLDTEIVYKFQRIIQRNDQGIVAVRKGVCEGCHMILPAQFANEVREGDKILFCPYCSRILFYQETEENEEEYYAMTEAGSLADLDDNTFDDEIIDDEDEDYADNDGYSDKSSDYDEDSEDEDDDEKDESDEDDSDEN